MVADYRNILYGFEKTMCSAVRLMHHFVLRYDLRFAITHIMMLLLYSNVVCDSRDCMRMVLACVLWLSAVSLRDKIRSTEPPISRHSLLIILALSERSVRRSSFPRVCHGVLYRVLAVSSNTLNMCPAARHGMVIEIAACRFRACQTRSSP